MITFNTFRVPPQVMAIIGLTIFSIALYTLVQELNSVSLADISNQFQAIPNSNFEIAALLTVISYFLLSQYDVMAFRYLKHDIGYRQVAPISFSAFAVGYNVGVASLSGGALRYRAYSLAGLTASQIALLIAFIALTIYLGSALLLALTILATPDEVLATFPINSSLLNVFAIFFLSIVILYILAPFKWQQPIQIGTFQLHFPAARMRLLQVLLSSVELLVTAMIFFALIQPFTDIPFLLFLSAFILAMLIGAISAVPGGIGVFESSMILLLPQIPVTELLGAALAFRLIYYVVPLLIAVGVIVLHEAAEHKQHLQEFSAITLEWATRIVPQTVGVAVFLAGAYLLVRGSIPLSVVNPGFIEAAIPLQLLEMSHLASSAIGVALLLLARGLYRRLHRAWLATLVLMIIAIVASVIQFSGFMHVAFLCLLLLFTWISRAEFYRGKPLLDQPFDSGWKLSIALVIMVAFSLGLFANRNVDYSSELWWQFTLDGEAPRMLRASLLSLMLLGAFGLARLLHGRTDIKIKPTPGELTLIKTMVAESDSSFANIALLGDKRIMLHPSGKAFLMYQASGSSWIALGDPIGDPTYFEELLWQYREACDANYVRCVFYQVGPKYMTMYVDLGLSFLKLGEEGMVNLETFSLEGSSRAEFRQAVNRAKRNGAEFSIIPASEVHAVMDELEAVSKHWLEGKSTEEKGFSLGFFDREYLKNFDIAVVRIQNQIVAFANLWQARPGTELSLDLMRYNDLAPKGIMDYLFTEIMLWGKANGFTRFSLGMAPLSGLESRELATPWHKVGNFIYRFAEDFYNFEGLRNYKDKFEPEWEPKFLACKGGMQVPPVLFDTTVLISGGLSGVLTK